MQLSQTSAILKELSKERYQSNRDSVVSATEVNVEC